MVRRPLTAAEAAEVMERIRTSPHITGYSLREWTGKRDTFLLRDTASGRVAGALLVHHLLGGWSEIAVVYVFEEHRGHGLGRLLLEDAVGAIRTSGRKLLLFFSSARMGHIAAGSGFDLHDSEADLTRGSLSRGLFLGILYKAQWLASLYRLREIRRKRRTYQASFDFQVAVLMGEGTR
ncbi:GNAT family N-acetyltransferase [Streptomyces sp. NPDC097107]|uniref:GNAT family N-acetyltransferase n=1 Tax=unclassified Streptomyces TaxID=2593676 RepID=UPI001B36EF90|nr:GNAT family N-acetyltransferase [Streptomyces sp. b94]MBQ1099048.1 GNAT family N-acetyltransferase [Streptomyces sp. b94]